MALPALITANAVKKSAQTLLKGVANKALNATVNKPISRRTALKVIGGTTATATLGPDAYDLIKEGVGTVKNMFNNKSTSSSSKEANMRHDKQESKDSSKYPTESVSPKQPPISGGGGNFRNGGGRRFGKSGSGGGSSDPRKMKGSSHLNCLMSPALFPLDPTYTQIERGNVRYYTSPLEVSPIGFNGAYAQIYVENRLYGLFTSLFARGRTVTTLPTSSDFSGHLKSVFEYARVLYWMQSIKYLREDYKWTSKCSGISGCPTYQIPDSVLDMATKLGLNTSRWPVKWEPHYMRLSSLALPPSLHELAWQLGQPFTWGSVDDVIFQFAPPYIVENALGTQAVVTEALLSTYLDNLWTTVKSTRSVSDALLFLVDWKICPKPTQVLDDDPTLVNAWINNASDQQPTKALFSDIREMNVISCSASKMNTILLPLYVTEIPGFVTLARGQQYNSPNVHTTTWYWSEYSSTWAQVPSYAYSQTGNKMPYYGVDYPKLLGKVVISVSGARISEHLVEVLPQLFNEEALSGILAASNGMGIRLNPRVTEQGTLCKVCPTE